MKSVFRVGRHTLNHKLFGTNKYLKLPQMGYSERMGELCGSRAWKCMLARFLILRSCEERQRWEPWRLRLERCDGPVLGRSLGKWKGIDF